MWRVQEVQKVTEARGGQQEQVQNDRVRSITEGHQREHNREHRHLVPEGKNAGLKAFRFLYSIHYL